MKLSRWWRWCHSWALVLCAILRHRVVDSATNQDDVNGLLALQDAWNAQNILQWTGNDPCGLQWPHIVCNDANPRRVIFLAVSGLSLTGTLPEDVGLLTALETLDLSQNELTGKLPPQLGKLVNLHNLRLQSNKFTGSIPPELGNLEQLQYMYLTSNRLQGPIPHEIGRLKNLYWFDIAGNGLQGELPYSSDGKNQMNVGLDNLTATRHFHFNNNSLEGSIPSAICHPDMALIHMLFDSNQMSGVIPDGIEQCLNLTILKLDHNKFSGTVPASVGKLVNLTELHLNSNQLTGELPDLTNLTKLNVLGLSDNQYAPSEFPAWMTSLVSLTDMQMDRANLEGPVPKTFFELPSLAAVNFDNNEVNGTLDLSTSKPSLLFLSLRNNNIGSTSLGNFDQELHLEGNPVCNTSAFANSQVCTQVPAALSQSYQSSTNCTNQCSMNSIPNPIDCSCAIPYKCHFTYRAPSFTTLSDRNHLKVFVNTVATNLNMSEMQIMVPEAFFNDQNQLFVSAWLFPNGTEIWIPEDVVRISSAAGNIFPPMFGPPMFQAEPYPFEWPTSTRGSGLNTGAKIGIGVGAVVIGLIVLGACIFAFVQKYHADKARSSRETYPASWGSGKTDSGGGLKLKGARWFSFAELKKATNNFNESNEIGSGGYGKVYRGELVTKEKIAIKRAEQRSMQGAVEFKNEIELLSRVHHRNVGGLVGFCFEQGEQMLIYDYMENGTLRDALYGYSGIKLDWRQRLHIALGTAQGLAYLHDLASPPIIHRDIKSSNILLDGKLNAKVADFGLSKIGPNDGKTHVTTQVKGTVGYLDPEYYLTQQLTEKSDVYSYGVVLLEMLTARQPIEHGTYIVREVKALLDKGGIAALRSILDPKLQHESMLEVQKFVKIAMHCTEESALCRPTMSEVVKEFEEFNAQELAEGGSTRSSKMFDGRTSMNKRQLSDSDYTAYSSKNSSRDSSFHDSAGFA
ncbi:hypothetical protein GOP47_0001610 [Adiantum capillus-veneris]|uniref:non-specific serine/threonine protein kinase n=1 Tax=Adiantum capillus-veneris TaxID=13818 RepID=A0A9D4VAE0_ADICA|nr:hypothetical protein GOP47_0001610 [Adiantum capillus-veneris]